MKKRGKRSNPQLSGILLVADFQTAITNLSTAYTASAMAEQSEANVAAALQYGSQNNGVFMTPGDMSLMSAEALAKSSVDAHLKKVQAEQINNYAAEQMVQLQEEISKKYIGRKVIVTRLSNSTDDITPLWTDTQTGELREGTYNGKTVNGTIVDLSVENNVLIIKPTLASRTVVPGRKFFLVTVINIETLEPAINVQLR